MNAEAREIRRLFINECLIAGMTSFSEISSFVRMLESTEYTVHIVDADFDIDSL